jgi:hypothetical protein
MVRFEEAAAHPAFPAPRGAPRVGYDSYIFAPSSLFVPRSDVPTFLAQLPSPALLLPTTTRGVVSLTLLDELRGERRASAQRALDLQRAGVERGAERLGLTDDSLILLQFADEEHFVSLGVVRERCKRFAVGMLTALRPYTDDDRAVARLMLVRSDGGQTWGDACPIEHVHPNPDIEVT